MARSFRPITAFMVNSEIWSAMSPLISISLKHDKHELRGLFIDELDVHGNVDSSARDEVRAIMPRQPFRLGER